MSDILKIATGPGVLETAFRSMQEQVSPPQADKTIAAYEKLFAPLPSATPGKPIERFTLTDPSIRTFIATTTDGSV